MAEAIAQTVFGLLFEFSADAAFIVDRRDGRVMSANLRASDMLALGVDALVGEPFGSLLFEPRELDLPGRYQEVAFRRSDDYPVYAELQVSHLEAETIPLAAYLARDTSERHRLECELQAKHTALFTAHAELERAHAQLASAKREVETRNQEIALLAWRGAMGELVAGIAHHLNNPVGALASTVRRLDLLSQRLPPDQRTELARLVSRVTEITRRIESNVAAIVRVSTATAQEGTSGRHELPPELVHVLATFTERLDDIPTKDVP